MSEVVKHYYAPIPNRAWADERLATRPLYLRVLALVAAHDRFNRNGKGCMLSSGRIAEKLGASQSKVAAALRALLEYGYLQRHPTPGHRQVYMHCVVYDATADKAVLKGKTQSRAVLGSEAKPSTTGDSVAPETQSRAVLHKRLSSKEKEDTPLKRKEDTPLQEARPVGRASAGVADDVGYEGKSLGLFERRELEDMVAERLSGMMANEASGVEVLSATSTQTRRAWTTMFANGELEALDSELSAAVTVWRRQRATRAAGAEVIARIERQAGYEIPSQPDKQIALMRLLKPTGYTVNALVTKQQEGLLTDEELTPVAEQVRRAHNPQEQGDCPF